MAVFIFCYIHSAKCYYDVSDTSWKRKSKRQSKNMLFYVWNSWMAFHFPFFMCSWSLWHSNCDKTYRNELLRQVILEWYSFFYYPLYKMHLKSKIFWVFFFSLEWSFNILLKHNVVDIMCFGISTTWKIMLGIIKWYKRKKDILRRTK